MSDDGKYLIPVCSKPTILFILIIFCIIMRMCSGLYTGKMGLPLMNNSFHTQLIGHCLIRVFHVFLIPHPLSRSGGTRIMNDPFLIFDTDYLTLFNIQFFYFSSVQHIVWTCGLVILGACKIPNFSALHLKQKIKF